VVATGTLEPQATFVVQSEIPGLVARVHADDGERVTRGEPLVELDRQRLEDQVAELRANLAAREALARVHLVARAEEDLAKARRDDHRSRELHERGILSESELDESAHHVALAEIALADARAEADAREAARDEAEKSLRRVERDLEKSVIRAPVDGVLVHREVEVGTAVADLQNGATVVAVIADDQRLRLLAEVDENDLRRVREGQPVEVRIDAFPDETFAGVVKRIASSGTSQGGVSSFQVEIEVPADPRVRVGMSADARIVVEEHHDVLLVPTEALLRGEDGARIRRPGADGAPELVPVTEIASNGFTTAIDAPLEAGAAILVRADGPDTWTP
jgi:HlyD family secretion protein